MREIKFRAWVKKEKVMLSHSKLFRLDTSNEVPFLPLLEKFTTDHQVMQYTGLKDKNGREIYEGDVVSGVTKQNLEVVFQQGSFGMNVMMRVSFHKDERKPFFTTLNCYESDDLEVIGNVYEDNHLLK